MYEIRRYLTVEGRDLYVEWHGKLRDRTAAVAIARRVGRMETENFGDCKPCRGGVWELRVDVGKGYRVYYAISGAKIVLLLCGGGKASQDADIDRAVECWQDWQRRANER